MIPWRKWNAHGGLEINNLCLVMRRSSAIPVVAEYRSSTQGTLFFSLNGYAVMDVTHYAVINRPGEEEA